MREETSDQLSDRCRRDWLRLIRSDRVGPTTFHRLLARYGSAGAALEALPELARRGGGAGRIRVCPAAAAEREIEVLDTLGARLVARGEAAYPPRLAHIEDAPPLLAILGDVSLLTKKAVAVVGARNASANGRRFAERMAADLGAGGFLVVSGMARGIDAAAHEGALASGTLAVLGGGVDVVYPRENADLYRRIVDRGVVVSEVAPGTQPRPRHFPRRNRIIAGVARGVVVVEAATRSGSLITARLALEQGREVFAVPGSAMDPRARGANHLIRQGATLTESADDVFEVLNGEFQPPTAPPEADFPEPPGAPETASESGFEPTAETGSEPASDIDGDDAGAQRARIETCLGPAPTAVDDLIRASDCPPTTVSTVLLELELAGRLERHPGNRVSLVGGG